MEEILPLDKRSRRMNLFDVRDEILEGIGYVEEVLEAGLNVTNKRDKQLYTPLLLNRLKTDEFSDEDLENSVSVICYTFLDLGRLSKFLGQFFRGFIINRLENGFRIKFIEQRHARICLYQSDEHFKFLRPRNYVEPPGASYEELRGSKYCTSVPCTMDKILLGPLEIQASTLRDTLNEIACLQSFRVCEDPRYFVFTFQESEFCDIFVQVTSHIFIAESNQPLVSERAYKGCSILNLSRNIPNLVPRRMTGPIALSKERTRIVVLLNVLGPWDTEVDEVLETVRRKSSEYGLIRNVVCPRPKTSSSAEQLGSSRIFVECNDLETSQDVYDGFGGLMFEDRIVVAGYYPELNYLVGEYE